MHQVSNSRYLIVHPFLKIKGRKWWKYEYLQCLQWVEKLQALVFSRALVDQGVLFKQQVQEKCNFLEMSEYWHYKHNYYKTGQFYNDINLDLSGRVWWCSSLGAHVQVNGEPLGREVRPCWRLLQGRLFSRLNNSPSELINNTLSLTRNHIQV